MSRRISSAPATTRNIITKLCRHVSQLALAVDVVVLVPVAISTHAERAIAWAVVALVLAASALIGLRRG